MLSAPSSILAVAPAFPSIRELVEAAEEFTSSIDSRSTLGPAVVVFQDVVEHNQPRYFTANLAHAYSVDGAAVPLCSATIATHAVQRVSEGILAQNLV